MCVRVCVSKHEEHIKQKAQTACKTQSPLPLTPATDIGGVIVGLSTCAGIKVAPATGRRNSDAAAVDSSPL